MLSLNRPLRHGIDRLKWVQKHALSSFQYRLDAVVLVVQHMLGSRDVPAAEREVHLASSIQPEVQPTRLRLGYWLINRQAQQGLGSSLL